MVEAHRAEIAITSLQALEVKQKIRGYDQDDEGHWRAKLDCGHYQHVRHDPPLTVREWTQTEEGRISRIGQELNCLKCEAGSPRDF